MYFAFWLDVWNEFWRSYWDTWKQDEPDID
jgi:hypothetical protein